MSNVGKILLVDDSPVVIQKEKQLLSKLGNVEIIIAETGKEAIQAVISQKPDIVFLDLMLPDSNGETICKIIKSRPELQSIAVVIVTAKDDPNQLQKAFQVGCDAYVTKPFDDDDLIRKAQILLSERDVVTEGDFE